MDLDFVQEGDLRNRLAEIQQYLEESERNLSSGIVLMAQRGKGIAQLQSEASALCDWSQKYLNETIAVKEESDEPLIQIGNWWEPMFSSLKQFWNYILLTSILLAVVICVIIGIILHAY